MRSGFYWNRSTNRIPGGRFRKGLLRCADTPETACLSQKSGTYFQVTHQVIQIQTQGRSFVQQLAFISLDLDRLSSMACLYYFT